MRFGSLMNEPAARMLRYGRDTQLGWESKEDTTGPFAANYELVGLDLEPNYNYYIYGYRITSGEPNIFYIRWLSDGDVKYHLVDFPSDGTVVYTDNIPINEGEPANVRYGSSIVRIGLFALGAGGAGVKYGAGLLIGRVDQ